MQQGRLQAKDGPSSPVRLDRLPADQVLPASTRAGGAQACLPQLSNGPAGCDKEDGSRRPDKGGPRFLDRRQAADEAVVSCSSYCDAEVSASGGGGGGCFEARVFAGSRRSRFSLLTALGTPDWRSITAEEKNKHQRCREVLVLCILAAHTQLHVGRLRITG
ncbi:hypothetical protein NDU88_003929 [Pleurodeles waltl]|uniref:Uncharacterized protein n=1 Tax=Pleurodeles waltl TaxID=8319 RepID=A0AAV7QDE6_PLEWA|nr:hypothetical protein NDU88_003929 [Pleurodeles waltl]